MASTSIYSERIPIEEVLEDKAFFKSIYKELSVPQRTIIKTIYGLKLSDEELVAWAMLQGKAHYDHLGYPQEIWKWPYEPKRYHEVWAILGRRSGKALAADTEIPTTQGFKPIKDITVCDEVFDGSGKPTKVIATTGILHNRPCYKITLTDKSTIIADAQHQWIVRSKNQRKHNKSGWLIKTTEELAKEPSKTGESNWMLPIQGAVEFEHKEFIIPPYVLGAWLGDGTSCQAAITSADKEIINEVEQYYPVKKRKATYAYGILLPFIHQLAQLNLINNKHIPPEYFEGSKEQRLGLLQGLLDTDGTCDKNGRVTFSNTNRKLAEGVRELVRSLGGMATIREDRAKLYGKDCGETFDVAIRIPVCPFRLSRKRQRWVVPKTGNNFITSIEQISSVPVCCIQVDAPDGSYQATRNYTVTHNSHVASLIMTYEAFLGGHLNYVQEGQDTVCYYVAQKLDVAKSQIKFIRSFIQQSKILSQEIASEAEDKITLKNGITIVASSPSLRGQRGLAVPVAILDEVGFWYSDPDSANPDIEVEKAIGPSQWQFPNYLRMGISTPYTKQGLLWKYWNAGTDGEKLGQPEEYKDVLVLHAPTAAMQNPTIKRKVLEKDYNKDKEGYRRESLAQFIDSVSGFLPEAVIKRAVAKGVGPTRPPQVASGINYVAAMDPAFRNDSFAFAIVHKNRENTIEVDALLRWTPEKGTRLNPSEIVAEITSWLSVYNISVVVSDQYQLETLQQLAQLKGWVVDGIQFTSSSKAKIFGDLAILFNTERISLLDPELSSAAKNLVEELVRLEQRKTSGGSVQISAPEGLHDDLVSALALACHRVLQINPTPQAVVTEAPKGILGVYLEHLENKSLRRDFDSDWD